ncbi:MAG: phosphoribosyltransferase family protein, partial [Pseudolysinimonas sp.]
MIDLRSAALDALAVLLPVECAGCGADDRGLCVACRDALQPEVSSRLVGENLRVWSGLEYDGVTRAVILALKRDGRMDAARALAPALAAAVIAAVDGQAGVDAIQVVAVPGTRGAYRRRGFDPVRVLIARAGLGSRHVFAPARTHEVQKLLTVDQRERNLRDAFRMRSAVAGHRILLIDDVVTSGATLREAARVLREAGADVVGAAVVASTPRRFAPVVEPVETRWSSLSRPGG